MIRYAIELTGRTLAVDLYDRMPVTFETFEEADELLSRSWLSAFGRVIAVYIDGPNYFVLSDHDSEPPSNDNGARRAKRL